MDITAFTKDDFDLKSWVNEALASKDSHETLDTHVTVLAMKLQLLAQEMNGSIEETSSHAVSSVPRALREIERLRKESSTLKSSLQGITHNVEEIEEKTYSSVRLISILDQTKARMISTSRLLHQVTRVQAFRRDVESLFETEDVELIAESLCETRETAKALVKMPEFKNIEEELDALSDRLVSRMQTELDAAISVRDTAKAKIVTVQLTKIGRESKIKSVYIALRKRPFVQYWQTHVTSTADAAPLGDRLAAFYDNCLRTFKEEVIWLHEAFPPSLGPRNLACTLLSDFLRSISLEYRSQIDASLVSSEKMEKEKDHKSKLSLLSHYRELARRFSVNVRNTLNLGQSQSQSNDAEAVKGKGEGDIDDVVMAILEPFFPYSSGFSSLLKAEFGALPPIKKIYADTVRAIDDEVKRLFLSCDGAVESCLKFSDGAEIIALLSVLNEVLVQYAERMDVLISKARNVMGLPDIMLEMENASSNSISTSISNPNLQGSLSFSLKIPEDKWARFQHTMLLVQSTYKATKRLIAFENSMRDKLLDVKVRDVLLESTAYMLSLSEEKDGDGDVKYKHKSMPIDTPVGLIHMMKEEDKLRKLRAILHSLSDSHYRLLNISSRKFNQVHMEAQRFIFDVMYEPIRSILRQYPSSPIWTAKEEASEYDNVDLPTFSHTPSALISAIGEYMMTLPQQLEPYEEYGFPIDESCLGGHVHEQTLDWSEHEKEKESEKENGSEAFGAKWLSYLAARTAGDCIVRILEISSVSDSGRKQLIADVGYISNVLTALGMPSELFPALDQLLKLVNALVSEGEDAFQKEVKAILTGERVARGRSREGDGEGGSTVAGSSAGVRNMTVNEISSLGQLLGIGGSV